MRGRLVGSLPVVEDGELVGIVTATDVFEELGRERVRKPDSARRAPMPARIARPLKRAAARAEAAGTPVHIRATGSLLNGADEDYLRRKLGRRLGKFASSIERTSVRVDDVNGPRGGVDKRCRIKVVLSGLPSVLVEERHHSLQAAMDRALARVEGVVREATKRRRLTPRRSEARTARALQ
jgi:CBS domain-containing protein